MQIVLGTKNETGFFFNLGAIVCFFSLEIINLTKSKYDDACDVFGGKKFKNGFLF